MPNIIEGSFTTPPGRFVLVAARFNKTIVDSLVTGCVDTLIRHGVKDEDIDVLWVPGSFELPIAAQRAAKSGNYSAAICLGTVIRGETSHYDHVAGSAASGIAQASLNSNLPVIFGVLTCDTLDQAINRSGAKSGNKGSDAALAAIEMVNLLHALDRQ